MLVVKGLYKGFGERVVLQDISFTLPSKGIVALLGPNGSGKTTLMRSLIGFYNLDAGEVVLSGHSVATDRIKMAEDIAYVPEYGGVYPEMTVSEYLKFMADIKHVSSDSFTQKAKELIKALDLDDVLSQRCETLSKGFSRRVAIAGGLISSPKFLILDEPCEGLDIKQKVNLRAFLKKCSRSCSILISTHIMEDVEALADRILLLLSGRLICDLTPQELKDKAHKASIEDSFFSLVNG